MQRLLLLTLLASASAGAENGYYSTRAYRVPSSVEQGGNSIVKILMVEPQSRRPLSWGTGFLVEDSQTLWTAAHVIGNSSQTNAELALELYDVVGQKIFDTATQDRAVVCRVGEENFGLNSANEKDFAKITLSRPLPLRALTVNSTAPKKGEDVYVVGFPAIDSIAEATRSTYKQGIMQSRVTMGQVIEPAQANQGLALARSVEQQEFIDRGLSKQMILIDADGYFGQSGAPIFNDRGEVVGIFTAIIRTPDQGPGTHINTKGIGPSFSGIFGR